jgi:hypothetical protein
MNQILLTIVICVSILSGIAIAQSTDVQSLETLGKELQHLRALPIGTKTNALCREDFQILKGITKEQLLKYLGEPDYCESESCTASDQWAYFFTAPVEKGQRGGGFPELTLSFASNNAVSSIECFYAR